MELKLPICISDIPWFNAVVINSCVSVKDDACRFLIVSIRPRSSYSTLTTANGVLLPFSDKIICGMPFLKEVLISVAPMPSFIGEEADFVSTGTVTL